MPRVIYGLALLYCSYACKFWYTYNRDETKMVLTTVTHDTGSDKNRAEVFAIGGIFSDGEAAIMITGYFFWTFRTSGKMMKLISNNLTAAIETVAKEDCSEGKFIEFTFYFKVL